MSQISVLLLLVMLLTVGAAVVLRGRHGSVQPAARPATRRAPENRVARAAAPRAPAPAPLPQEPLPPALPMPAGVAPPATLRDRYIKARFAGLFEGSAGLGNATAVVKAARLYFEDGKIDRAHELLAMAIEQSPREKALWLAVLEVSFLIRNGPLFTRYAAAYRAAEPESPEWPEVCRLGRAVAPGERLFGTAEAPRKHSQYGPWPDTPNWIQASWDLTSDVLASDFHRALAKRRT